MKKITPPQDHNWTTARHPRTLLEAFPLDRTHTLTEGHTFDKEDRIVLYACAFAMAFLALYFLCPR
jgi:hypothetical protein